MSYIIQGYEIQGDNLILDILGIAYDDLGKNGFTSYSKLIKIINSVYPPNERMKHNHTITTVTGSHWFGRAGKNVHLTERGVEFYLQMLQSYESQKHTTEAILLAKKSVVIAWYGLILTILTLGVTIFTVIKS
jgi:hypothetical protein